MVSISPKCCFSQKNKKLRILLMKTLLPLDHSPIMFNQSILGVSNPKAPRIATSMVLVRKLAPTSEVLAANFHHLKTAVSKISAKIVASGVLWKKSKYHHQKIRTKVSQKTSHRIPKSLSCSRKDKSQSCTAMCK